VHSRERSLITTANCSERVLNLYESAKVVGVEELAAIMNKYGKVFFRVEISEDLRHWLARPVPVDEYHTSVSSPGRGDHHIAFSDSLSK